MALYNNKQEILQAVEAHFSQPGAQLSKDFETNHCFYRNGSDPHSPIRCAVGALIPDDLYDSRWEYKTVESIFDNLVDKGIVADDEDVAETLLILQENHDDSETVEGFLERFDDVKAFFSSKR